MYECNLIWCPVFEGAGDKSREDSHGHKTRSYRGQYSQKGQGVTRQFLSRYTERIYVAAVDFSEWHIGKADFIIGFSTTQDHRILFYYI